jgi:hypothetical protein
VKFYFTKRSLQFSKFAHKSLGSPISLPSLFFLSLCFILHRRHLSISLLPFLSSTRLGAAPGSAGAARAGVEAGGARELSVAAAAAGAGTGGAGRGRARLGRPRATGGCGSVRARWSEAGGAERAPGERGRLRRVGAGAGRAGAGLARERHVGPGNGVQGNDVQACVCGCGTGSAGAGAGAGGLERWRRELARGVRRGWRQSGATAGDGAQARERGRRCGAVLADRRGPAGRQRGPHVKELRHVRRGTGAGAELGTGGSVQARAWMWRCCSGTVQGGPAPGAVESRVVDVGGR